MRDTARSAGAVAFVLTWAGVAVAQSPHVSEAITHTQAAVAQGKQGYPDALATQAQEALKHPEAAKKQIKSPHLDEGLRLLHEAISLGGQGHGDPATKSAENALMHLQELTQASAEAAQGDAGY